MNRREFDKQVRNEAIKKEYQSIVEQSKEYARMTQRDKDVWREDVLRFMWLSGTSKQKWETMQNCYRAYLLALGYLR